MPWDINDSNSNKHVFYHRVFSILRGRLGAEWLGCWICDQRVVVQILAVALHWQVQLWTSCSSTRASVTKQYNWYQPVDMMPCCWERYHSSDVALATCHRHWQFSGLGEGDDHPPVFSSRVWWTLIFIPHSSATMCSRGDSFLECWGSFGQMPLLMTATAGEIWILPLPPPPLAYFS